MAVSPTASGVARYAVAVGATAIALALRVVTAPLWGAKFPIITFYPAVLVSAWFGGLWPGVLATLLSASALSFLWLSMPHGPDLGDVVDVLVFLAMGALMSCLVGALHSTRGRLAQNATYKIRC